jgi:hypothetical protein
MPECIQINTQVLCCEDIHTSTFIRSAKGKGEYWKQGKKLNILVEVRSKTGKAEIRNTLNGLDALLAS